MSTLELGHISGSLRVELNSSGDCSLSYSERDQSHQAVQGMAAGPGKSQLKVDVGYKLGWR